MISVTRPLVDGLNILHRRYKCAACLRRDDPLLFKMRLELVFFRTRPIVLSLARSTMLSSTTFFSKRRSVHFVAFGRSRAGQGDELGLFFAMEDGCNGRRCALLALQYRVDAALGKLLPDTG